MSADQPAPRDPQAWQVWPTPPGVPDRVLLDLLTTDAAGRAAAMLAGAATATQDAVVDAVRLLATGSAAAHAGTAARADRHPRGRTAPARPRVSARRDRRRVRGARGDPVRRRGHGCGGGRGAQTSDVRSGELSVEPGHVADTGAGVLLRLGPDGRWYPFTLAREQWWPAAGANASAGTAYQAAVRARTQRRASG